MIVPDENGGASPDVTTAASLSERCQNIGGSYRLANHPPVTDTIMNTLAKWNPLNELSEVQNKLTSLFGRLNMSNVTDAGLSFADWSPLADISENNKEFIIRAELPDVKKEDVKVLVENGVLRISGERHMEKEEKDEKHHRIERAYGTFERSFTLPENTKPNSMTAEYKDGMLTISIPKTAESNPKAIEVKVH